MTNNLALERNVSSPGSVPVNSEVGATNNRSRAVTVPNIFVLGIYLLSGIEEMVVIKINTRFPNESIIDEWLPVAMTSRSE